MCVCFCFDLLLLAPRLPLYENCVQKNVNSCPLFTMFVRFCLFCLVLFCFYFNFFHSVHVMGIVELIFAGGLLKLAKNNSTWYSGHVLEGNNQVQVSDCISIKMPR